jgi:hypothetical protein
MLYGPEKYEKEDFRQEFSVPRKIRRLGPILERTPTRLQISPLRQIADYHLQVTNISAGWP